MIFTRNEIKLRYQSNILGSEEIRLGVAVGLINKNNQILLEQRSDCGWWGITGGKLEMGETIEECAAREVKEESNLEINQNHLELIGIYSNKNEGRILQYSDNRVHLIDIVFTTKVENLGNIKKSNESLKLEFFNFNKLPNLIVPPAVKPIGDISLRYK
tara:strand:- start:550 stop:1026 length:477 start_codon:yes stop_codon:yes gene_type:complete